LKVVNSFGVPLSMPSALGAVVAADVDDERVVELAHVLDRLDDAADLVIGVGEVGGEDVGLLDEQLLLLEVQRACPTPADLLPATASAGVRPA
jgi:hypothetical protein